MLKKKKKICFYSFSNGNMEVLTSYFKKRLEQKLKDKISLKYVKLGKPNKNRLIHYAERLKLSLKKYDLVVSDYSTKLFSTGRKSIFMSHGYGTKMTPGLDELSDRSRMKLYGFMREKIDYVITLSKRDSNYFLRSSALDQRRLPQYVPLGLPRNDVLLNPDYVKKSGEELKKRLEAGSSKILLYAPTWRGNSIPEESIFNRKIFSDLNRRLGKLGWIMCYRPHNIDSIFNMSDIEGLENIKVIDSLTEPDTQKVLTATDLLLTDYSSIYVDYLLLDRPMAFFPFDLSKYAKKRGLVIDFDKPEETPGPRLKKLTEICDYIDDIESQQDPCLQARDNSKRLFHEHLDGMACKRIWDLIFTAIE